MNITRRFIRTQDSRSFPWTIVLAQSLFLTIISVACCCNPQFLAIPEGKLRIEDTVADRISLPLNEVSIQRIERFIMAGGVRHSDDPAEFVTHRTNENYAPLLRMLQDPDHLTVADVTSKKTFARWLKYPPVSNVVDAREWGKIFPRPAALSDGQYWWVFYPDGSDRLRFLLIVNSRTEAPSENQAIRNRGEM